MMKKPYSTGWVFSYSCWYPGWYPSTTYIPIQHWLFHPLITNLPHYVYSTHWLIGYPSIVMCPWWQMHMNSWCHMWFFAFGAKEISFHGVKNNHIFFFLPHFNHPNIKLKLPYPRTGSHFYKHCHRYCS